MALSTQMEIELPLLEVLVEMGGKGKPRDIYPLVTKKFHSIAKKDLQISLTSGGNKWTNNIQWARQRLIYKGEMATPERGIWEITDRGRERLKGKREVGIEEVSVPTRKPKTYRDYDERIIRSGQLVCQHLENISRDGLERIRG